MPEQDLAAYVYLSYAVFSVAMTIWLARMLATNGRVFLEDVFVAQPALATAVNRLLVVGFYLFNLGWACLLLEGAYAPTLTRAIEALSFKVGWLLLSLAFMHFLNMFILHRIRRRGRRAHEHPPVMPAGFVAPATIAPQPTAA